MFFDLALIKNVTTDILLQQFTQSKAFGASSCIALTEKIYGKQGLFGLYLKKNVMVFR